MSRRRKLKINVRTGLPRPELRPWSEYGRKAVRACFEAQAWRDGIILIWNDPADWETLDDMRWEYAYGRHQEVHAIGATDRDALEEMVTSLRQARLHLSAAFCETDGLLWVWDNVFHPSMTGHDITADDEQRAAWRKCVATGLEQVGDLIEKLEAFDQRFGRLVPGRRQVHDGDARTMLIVHAAQMFRAKGLTATAGNAYRATRGKAESTSAFVRLVGLIMHSVEPEIQERYASVGALTKDVSRRLKLVGQSPQTDS